MFENLTDDQIALIGSAAAVFASAIVMVSTYSVRRMLRGENQALPESLKVPHRRPEQKRRAA
ncbi:MAG: hypothetical protein WD069_01435 [Planctomycetales bacterium]